MRKTMRKKMQWLLLWRSFQRRRRRVMAAVLAVLMGSSMVTAFLGVATDISGKLGRELRAYGANILVVPRGGDLEAESTAPGTALGATTALKATLKEGELVAITSGPAREQVVGAAPYLYAVVEIKTGSGGPKKVVLAGVRFALMSQVSPWWKVEGDGRRAEDQDGNQIGSEAESPAGMVIGAAVARKLRLRPGDAFLIEAPGGMEERFTVTGVVNTGGPEDDQVFADLDVAQKLTGQPEAISMIQVSALTDRVPLQKTV
ncbi:MAG: ABC transporter permease, partial [Syntrophothermus sp.]